MKKHNFAVFVFLCILVFSLNSLLANAEPEGRPRHNTQFRKEPPFRGEHKPPPREMLYNPQVNIEKKVTDLQFIPDQGIRIEFANLPNAGINPRTGEVHLYYNSSGSSPTMRGGPMHAISTDGLNFTRKESLRSPEHETKYPYDSRNTLLPDGNWRRYGIKPGRDYVTSDFSSDGINFRPEEGIRYELKPDDYGWMGVNTVFINPLGDLVYLYLGDKHGLNNARIAYSKDGGKTFEFKKANVFGDAQLGGGGQSFVDPASVVLPDGRVRIITMRMCHIYTFISTDKSCTTFAYEGLQLEPSDFTEFETRGFFDPKLVLLSDGAMRLYAATTIEQADGSVIDAIVSATSKPIK